MTKGSSWLQLRLLGSCEISWGDEKLNFESNKVRALLIYLVMNPGPHQRDKLIDLFWGEFPESNARRNLRHTLWNLRKQINKPDLQPVLLTDPQTAAINPETDIWTDVAAFHQAVNIHVDKQESAALYELSAAMELYQGDFLEGFHIRGAGRFEEWALVERERLRTLALMSIQWLTLNFVALNENQKALIYARRWLSMSPWQEEAHRQVMRLLAASGQRDAALEQFERCRQTLAAELAVEPDKETIRLFEEIRRAGGGADCADVQFQRETPPLPFPPTPFIGREEEMADVFKILDDPCCRLLTLTGPGGIGKTRLALQIASKINVSFDQEVAFVPLVDIGMPQEIPRAIVNGLGFTLFGAQTPFEQLCDYLSEKQTLLVLDNFEHLVEGAALVREILDAAPSVKVLITSREKLNLQGEWVYNVEGMNETQACQLFEQTARRLAINHKFQEDERHIVQISRLVSGVPLAIELAASWVRVLSCQEIVEELESHQAPVVLTANLRDVPFRHRSLRAVFEHSWNLLRGGEKQILMYLTVFRDGFHREAARIVAGAALTDLSVLVDKSLLRRRLNGRYELHGLIRRFAAEKLLLSKGENEIRKKHAQYFCQLLDTHQESLQELLSIMRLDYENIRAVWVWAALGKDMPIIEMLHAKIYMYFEVQSAFLEGVELFRETIEVLTGEKDPEKLSPNGDDLLLWKLLAEWSALNCRLGKLEVARETFSRCVDVFRLHGDQEELAFSLFYLGDTTRLLGDYHQAKGFIQESLALYRAIGKQSDVAFALNVLGLIYAAEGDLTKAKTLLEESRAAFLEIDHTWGLAIANINLGSLLKTLQKYPSAVAMLQESLGLCQRLGHRWAAAVCLSHLGEIAQVQHDLVSARGHYFRSFLLYKEIGFSPGILDVSLRLVDVLQKDKNNKLALALLLKANREYQKIESQEIEKNVAKLKERLSSNEVQEAEEISEHKSFEEMVEM